MPIRIPLTLKEYEFPQTLGEFYWIESKMEEHPRGRLGVQLNSVRRFSTRSLNFFLESKGDFERTWRWTTFPRRLFAYRISMSFEPIDSQCQQVLEYYPLLDLMGVLTRAPALGSMLINVI